jgi:AraC-like DNA-binding protein
MPLARRALEAGYADQAHMGADVRRLVGTTPAAWLGA